MIAFVPNIDSIHAKERRRTILLITLTLYLSIAAYARDASQIKDALKMEKPPLEFKLIALTPTACIGDPLKLRLEVTNIGQETLKLNRAYFWDTSRIYLSAEESKGEDKEFFYEHFWPRSTSEDIVFLASGKTYVAHTYWPFYGEGNKFGVGNYILQIWLFSSNNKVQFEIKECKRKEVKER
jgi:hypothetical protein